MTIVRDRYFSQQLHGILKQINRDKVSASIQFERELNQKIKNLVDFPYQYRASYYFEDPAYRDLVYKGYTVIYKVEAKRIVILEIFKWQDR